MTTSDTKMILLAILGYFLGPTSCLSLASGCASPQANPKEFAEVFKAVGASTLGQAAWENITTDLDGQVISPGMEAYARVEYAAGVRLPGTAGHVGLNASGTGSQPSPEAQKAILDILSHPENWEQLLKEYQNAKAHPDTANPDVPD